MISAREAALLTLYEVFYNDAYSNLALKDRMKKNKDMPAAEKALLTNLVYGVVSRHYTLIHIIKKYSKVKLNKLDKNILIILQLGLYQLLYTDKIPESAAVNESVKLVKNQRLKGFVNAVLRSFIRDGKKIDYPEDDIGMLSVKHSYSPELVRLFIDNFHDRAESVMVSLNESPQLLLRANILKINAEQLAERLKTEGVEAHVTDEALVAAEGFDIASSELYKKGFFSVQDAAAYNTAIILGAQPGETIIDMCAAPGGKTTHIAELTGDKAKIISCDVHEHKIRLIKNAAKRLGLKSINARVSDGTVTENDFIMAADRVLCDVPCSGLGIIRRKPDIKLRSVADLSKIQLAILKNGAKYVKSGGTLVYSTCTINRAENEEITNTLLETGEFKKIYEKTFLPDEDRTDGFYICKMERK